MIGQSFPETMLLFNLCILFILLLFVMLRTSYCFYRLQNMRSLIGHKMSCCKERRKEIWPVRMIQERIRARVLDQRFLWSCHLIVSVLFSTQGRASFWADASVWKY